MEKLDARKRQLRWQQNAGSLKVGDQLSQPVWVIFGKPQDDVAGVANPTTEDAAVMAVVELYPGLIVPADIATFGFRPKRLSLQFGEFPIIAPSQDGVAVLPVRLLAAFQPRLPVCRPPSALVFAFLLKFLVGRSVNRTALGEYVFPIAAIPLAFVLGERVFVLQPILAVIFAAFFLVLVVISPSSLAVSRWISIRHQPCSSCAGVGLGAAVALAGRCRPAA